MDEELDNRQRFDLNERVQTLKARLLEDINGFNFNGAALTRQEDGLSFDIFSSIGFSMNVSFINFKPSSLVVT